MSMQDIQRHIREVARETEEANDKAIASLERVMVVLDNYAVKDSEMKRLVASTLCDLAIVKEKLKW